MNFLKMLIAYLILMLLDYILSKLIGRQMGLGDVFSSAFAFIVVWISVRSRDRNQEPK